MFPIVVDLIGVGLDLIILTALVFAIYASKP